MPSSPTRRHRRTSLRKPGYDYASPGAYFVTLATHERLHLFGQVVDHSIQLSAPGQIVLGRWQSIPDYFPCVQLDQWIIMPNHLHAILWITERDVDNFAARHTKAPSAQGRSLSTIVGNFKSTATRQINRQRSTPGMPVWQDSFYDRIIQTNDELRDMRAYIAESASRWIRNRYRAATVEATLRSVSFDADYG